jgi:hypothetical protein
MVNIAYKCSLLATKPLVPGEQQLIWVEDTITSRRAQLYPHSEISTGASRPHAPPATSTTNHCKTTPSLPAHPAGTRTVSITRPFPTIPARHAPNTTLEPLRLLHPCTPSSLGTRGPTYNAYERLANVVRMLFAGGLLRRMQAVIR